MRNRLAITAQSFAYRQLRFSFFQNHAYVIAENAFEPVGTSDAFMRYVNNFQAKNEVTFRESF